MSKRDDSTRLKDAALGCLDAIDVLQIRPSQAAPKRYQGVETIKESILRLKDEIEAGNSLLPSFREALCGIRVPGGILDIRFAPHTEDNLDGWLVVWQDIPQWSAHAAALGFGRLFWETAVVPHLANPVQAYLDGETEIRGTGPGDPIGWERPILEPKLDKLDRRELAKPFLEAVFHFPRLMSPAALRAQIEQEAEHLLQQLVVPKAGESTGQDDTQDDNEKKPKKYKRKMNQAALVCAERYREAKRKKPETTMEEVVQGYVNAHSEESYSSIWRTLNDNPDQWKT